MLALGVAYAALAATTTPFTWQADAVTALPLAVLTAASVIVWPLRPRPVPLIAAAGSPAARHRSSHMVGWVVLLLAVVAWELTEYLAPGSRAAHPTLSSMLDAVDRVRPLKALVFLTWLALGWWIVRSGEPARSTCGDGQGER